MPTNFMTKSRIQIFELEFDAVPGLTELMLHPLVYPDGFNVTLSPAGAASWAPITPGPAVCNSTYIVALKANKPLRLTIRVEPSVPF